MFSCLKKRHTKKPKKLMNSNYFVFVAIRMYHFAVEEHQVHDERFSVS